MPDPNKLGCARSLTGPGWLPLLAVLLITAAITAPALRLGYVSDDLVHLVEDRTQPLTYSSDHLHRPLRNVFFKLVAASDLSPAFWHVVMLFGYLATTAAVFYFGRRLTGNAATATILALLFACFPRNHQVIFWLASWQDAVVAIAVLVMFIRQLRREAEPTLTFALSQAALLLFALGWKETTVTIVPLLALADWYRGKSLSHLRHKRYVGYYALLLLMSFGFVAWVKLTSAGSQLGTGPYGMRSIAGGLAFIFRNFLSCLLPFGPPASLHDLSTHPWKIAFALGVSALVIVAVIATKRSKLLVFGVAWFVITLLPTALFGAIDGDRYLFMPYIGLALIAADCLASLCQSSQRNRIILGAALIAFVAASFLKLNAYRAEWRRSTDIVAGFERSAQRLIAAHHPSSLLVFNVPHNVGEPQVTTLNNGCPGALIVAGLPHGTPAQCLVDSDIPPDETAASVWRWNGSALEVVK